MERDRMKLREALKNNAAGTNVTEVYLDLNTLTDPDVLQMRIEEVKHCYGEDIPIHLVHSGANPMR